MQLSDPDEHPELDLGLGILDLVRTFLSDPSGQTAKERLRGLDHETLLDYAQNLALFVFTSAARLGEPKGQTVDQVLDEREATIRQNEANRLRFEAEDAAAEAERRDGDDPASG
jgi:phosphoribosylformylglycinamidine (FGAM) synthase PurS component